MVSALLRGEKPATNQSLVPMVLLYGREPKPTIDGPHITARSPVMRSNSERSSCPSVRRRSSATESRNSVTLSSVGRVLISATITLWHRAARTEDQTDKPVAAPRDRHLRT